MSDMIPIKNGFKQGDALSPLLFNFPLVLAIKKVLLNQVGLKINGTHQFLVFADDVNILGGSALAIQKNREVLVVASEEIRLEVNVIKP